MSRPSKSAEANYVEVVSYLFLAGVILGVLLPAWGNVQEQKKRRAQVIACYGNLVTISQAMEAYKAQHDGFYPRSLSELTSGQTPYLKDFPRCPAAEMQSYDGKAYTVRNSSSGVSRYTMFCAGNNHVDAGLRKNQPIYDSLFGKVQPDITTIEHR